MPLAAPEAINEREAVLSGALDHDDGRRSLSKLDKVHDEELELFLCASCCFNEADE